jgi:hypothetical protein
MYIELDEEMKTYEYNIYNGRLSVKTLETKGYYGSELMILVNERKIQQSLELAKTKELDYTFIPTDSC